MPFGRSGAQWASRLIAGVVTGGVLTALLATSVAAADPADGGRPESRRVTDLSAGRIVRDHGISIVAPPRGHAVWGELWRLDGTYQVLQVHTTRQGVVRLMEYGDESAAMSAPVVTGRALADGDVAAHPTSATPDTDGKERPECLDRASNPYWWRTPDLRWRFRAPSTPRYLRTDGLAPVKGVVDTIIRANTNITEERNVCGRPDQISAKFHYLGWTSRRPDVTSGAHCAEGDGQSVIGFGSLPSWSIAMTCVYQVRDNIAREADIRISTDIHWVLSGEKCSHGEYLESAMTHEFGHVYGLAHVSSSTHPTLTMQPYIWYCTMNSATLGFGDWRGLERKY